MKILCICKLCEKEFYRFPSAIKNGRGIYCSRECLYISTSNHNKEIGNKPPVKYGVENHKYRKDWINRSCSICNKEFRQKYENMITCSQECGRIKRSQTISGAANNPFSRNHPAKVKICVGCKEEYSNSIEALKRGIGVLYCSIACFRKHSCSSYRVNQIVQFLEELGYSVQLEKTWIWLISPHSNYPMRMDIYIVDKNCVIEFDGRHHWAIGAFGQSEDGLRKVIEKDRHKEMLLEEHHIPLLRMRYPIDYEAIKLWIESI